MNSVKSRKKIKETKEKRHGDPNYNNPEKNQQTMLERHSVPYAFWINKSNGHRISKIQREIYEQTKEQFPDAELEVWLDNVEKSVDIFIPSQNKIIEVNGDYWHCNPNKYSPDYFNKSVKLSAQQIWDRDKNRIDELKSYGYNVEVIWENK